MSTPRSSFSLETPGTVARDARAAARQLSPVLLLITGAQAALGYGLLTNRLWARPMGTFLWLGVGFLTGGPRAIACVGADQYCSSLLWGRSR